MSIEQNEAIIRRYLDEAWNRGNVDIVDELMSSNYARYISGNPDPLDREGQKQRIISFRRAFPDLHLTRDDLIAAEDKVVFRMTFNGTHQGTFMRTPPSNVQVTVGIIDIARIANGKIVEHWGVTDTLGLLQQIGAVPV